LTLRRRHAGVSCLEATSGNHSNYSCELNQFYRYDERNPFYLSR